jgi:hypothetical protein
MKETIQAGEGYDSAAWHPPVPDLVGR